MYDISKITIKRFRSNYEIKLDIKPNHITTICGANNSGKTNTLRAINIFFNPTLYKKKRDVPFHKLEGSRGASQYPEISIVFSKNNINYEITKKFGMEEGICETTHGKNLNTKNILNEDEIKNILDTFQVYFIESINVNFPELINKIINDIYENEFSKSRINKNLRDAFNLYIEGVLNKLNILANDISDNFKSFNVNWGVEFSSKTNISKFTDLINDDIEFLVKDKSNKYLDSKGSGLQKLAYILLVCRLIENQKNKKSILLIDEPDTFLHDKLQRELNQKLNSLLNQSQIFLTTHSKVLIDTYTLKNVFLYDIEYDEKNYVRKKGRDIYQTKTKLVDLNEEDGSLKIKEYLGVKEDNFDILNGYNILVEGVSDKKYLEELAKYLKIVLPKIESVNGADNLEKYLSFYNSVYSKVEDKKPKILILLDNDLKGKEVQGKLNKKISSLNNLLIKILFITNKTQYTEYLNYEIEDFLEPKILHYLTNNILSKAGNTKIPYNSLSRKLSNKELSKKGILSLLEYSKSECNMEGTQINIESENFKKNLAENFSIEGNMKIINFLNNSEKLEEMKLFLQNLSDYKNFFEE